MGVPAEWFEGKVLFMADGKVKVMRLTKGKGAEEVEIPKSELESEADLTIPPHLRAPKDDTEDALPVEETSNGEDDEILQLLGDPSEVIVVPREIEVKGVKKTVFIKQLSVRQNNFIEAQKYRRGVGGAVTLDPRNADTNMTAHLLHLAVVKNAGTAANPVWVPRYEIEQLLGFPAQGKKPAKPGLMDAAGTHAKLFITQLAVLCMEVNEGINPDVTVPEA